MRPRFQADADLNHKIVLGFRRREPAADFLDAKQGHLIGISDPEILTLTARSGRMLVSHDRKTMPRHFAHFITHSPSPGLIVVGQHLEIGSAIEDLLLIWAASEAEEWVGKIGFVPL